MLFRSSGSIPVLDDELELTAYRIVQEAVTNVIRHAQASRAQITIDAAAQSLKLNVSDNGRGAQTLQREGHYGIRGMQERAESHGGSIRFDASSEGGLEVRVVLPLQSRDNNIEESTQQ